MISQDLQATRASKPFLDNYPLATERIQIGPRGSREEPERLFYDYHKPKNPRIQPEVTLLISYLTENKIVTFLFLFYDWL